MAFKPSGLVKVDVSKTKDGPYILAPGIQIQAFLL
jgi:hypothetical protein